MKRTKRTLSVLLSIVLVFSLLPTVISAATNPTVTIGGATATLKVGDTVAVDLTLSDNPGITGGAVDITFDNTALELTNVENRTNLLVGTSYYGYTGFPITSGNYTLGWDGDLLSADITDNGVLATLVFTIIDGATVGDKSLTVDNIDFVNHIGDSLTGTGIDGKITLTADVSTVSASIAAPTKGATPQSEITGATEYTGTISWEPNNTTFAADTAYTATITLTANAGYKFTDATTVTIAGADSVSAPTVASDGSTITFTATFPATAGKDAQTLTFTETAVNKTYGDPAFTVTATRSVGDGAVTYASGDTAVATVNANSGEVTIVGAGSTTITATAAETALYAKSTASYTLTVAQADQTLSFATPSVNKTYGDDNFTVTATHSTGDGAVTYASDTPSVATVNTNTGEVVIRGAGRATITATAAATDNCNEATASYTLTVEKANVSFTAPAAKAGLKYNGNAQELIVAGATPGGTMQYSLASDSGYSTTIPTGTDVGNYTVYWRIVGDNNYNDLTLTSPISVTIEKGDNPATLTATSVTVKLGNTVDLSVLVSDAAGGVSYGYTSAPDGCTLDPNGTFHAGTTAGTCKVTVTVAGNDNYNGATLGPIVVSVVAKDPQSLAFDSTTVNKTYGDAAFTVTANQTPASGGGAVTYASSDTAVATVNENTGEVTILKAGTTTITATAAENSDYAVATASYTLTVDRATVTVTAKNHTITYGDAPTHAPENDGVEYSGFLGSDTAASAVSGSVTFIYTYNKYDDIGRYNIVPVILGLTSDNYKFTAVNGTLTVNPLEAALSWTGDSFDYDGLEHAPTATVTNLVDGDDCTVTVSGAQTDAGENYTATATALTNANYKLPASATHNFTINKRASAVTTVPAAVSGLEYTGSAMALVTAGTADGGEMQYSLTSGGTYSATIPTGTDAGNYNVYYKVVGDNNHNDTTEAGPVAVTIAKGTQTLAFADAAVTKTYGDAAFTVTASQTPASGGGAVTYASSDTAVATVDTNSGEVTILKAGSATITATAAENTNCLPATTSYALTVNKAGLTVKAKDHTITYGDAPANNGAEYIGFANGDTESVLSGIGYTYNYAQYGDVGEYSITPADTLTADNYTITRQPGKLTVDPLEAALSWTGGSFDYDESEHAPTATVTNLVNGDDCTVTVSGAQTNAGENYTATATALSNTNYKLPDDATHAFKINKAASSVDTVPAAVSNLEYTGSAQALVSAGAANGGEVQYSLATGGTYSAAIPTGTNAGDYTVYYKVVGDANHNDVAEAGPIAVTIAKGTDPAKLAATTVNVKLEGTDDLSAMVSDAVGDVSYTITSTLDGCSVAADGTFTAGAAEGTCVVTVAVAESTNYNGKTVGTITVNVMPVVETPVLSESSQTFSGTLSVTINCTTGAAIYYTLDGTDPTSASTPYTEGDTITITETTTLKVIAVMPGHLDSEIAEATYTKASSGGGGGGGGGAAAPETNTVTPATAENGTVTVSPKEAAAGDTVTITPTPDDGYQVGKVVVKDANGKEIKVTEKDGKYTFTMPDSAVTIETVFEEASETPADGHFVDVHEGDYYYDAVEWAAKNNITNGVSKDKFGPAIPCTRAQVVTFLWVAGGSQDEGVNTGFEDVDINAYYDKAVAWAVTEGITAGTSEDEFSPDLIVTRAQFLTMLWVYKGMPTVEGVSPFTDVPADAYYAKAVAWAYANGITAGKSATSFAPDDPCTRGQIVTFLYNALAD